MSNGRIIIMFGEMGFVRKLRDVCEDNGIRTTENDLVVVRRTNGRTKIIEKWIDVDAPPPKEGRSVIRSVIGND